MDNVERWRVTCKVDDGRGNGGCNQYATHVSLTAALTTMVKHFVLQHGEYMPERNVFEVQAQMWVKVP